jgi:hypothetical protein
MSPECLRALYNFSNGTSLEKNANEKFGNETDWAEVDLYCGRL